MTSVEITKNNLKNIVNECIDNYLKSVINESQGIIEKGMLKFAEYLYTRCFNNKRKPNKYGEIVFTIPATQWNKYNNYNLNCEKITVILSYNLDDEAYFSYNRGKPEIAISPGLLINRDIFVSTLMHELTHAVNAMSNLQKGSTPHLRKNFSGKLQRVGAMPDSIQGEIEYYFMPTEVNARLNEAYYYLMQKYNNKYNRLDLEDSLKTFSRQEVAYFLFDEIDKISRYGKMRNLIGEIFDDKYNTKTIFKFIPTYGVTKKLEYRNDTIINKMTLNGKKLNSTPEFIQYTKQKLDIIWYMQNILEKFKKKLYKMINRFIDEFENLGS